MLLTKVYVTYRAEVAFASDDILATPLLPVEACTLL
jgi:hypothetical protein